MATILATLHIGKDKDEQGNELEVLTDSTSELIVYVSLRLMIRPQ